MSSRTREKLFVKMTALAIDWPLVISRIPNAKREIPARLPVTPRCVEKWMHGTSKPEADNVVGLFAHFDEFADALLEQTNRKEKGLTWEQRAKLLQILGEG